MSERVNAVERQPHAFAKLLKPMICGVRVLRLSVVFCKEPVRFHPFVAEFERLAVLVLAQLAEQVHNLLWELQRPLRHLGLGWKCILLLTKKIPEEIIVSFIDSGVMSSNPLEKIRFEHLKIAYDEMKYFDTLAKEMAQKDEFV